MDRNLLLTITSLVLLLLLSVHVTDDLVHGLDSVGPWNMAGMAVAALLLYGTVTLRRRLAGHIVMLFIAIFAAGMPVIHLRGASIQEIAHSSGAFFFLWVLWALGVGGVFGIILSIDGIVRLRRAR